MKKILAEFVHEAVFRVTNNQNLVFLRSFLNKIPNGFAARCEAWLRLAVTHHFGIGLCPIGLAPSA